MSSSTNCTKTAGTSKTPNGAPALAVSQWLGLVVMGIGVLALTGWILNIDAFIRLADGFASMKLNTALCFITAGGALYLLAVEPVSTAFTRTAFVCSLFIALISGLTLVEYATGLDLGIDELLIKDSLGRTKGLNIPGRMSPGTALSFLFTAGSFVCLILRKPTSAQFFALVTGSFSFLALMGYFYDVSELYSVPVYSSMALHTSLGFLALAGGLVLARPAYQFILEFNPDKPGFRLAWKELLPAVLLTVLAGAVISWSESKGFVGPDVGAGILVTFVAIVTSVVVWASAQLLNQAAGQLHEEHKKNVDLRAALDEHAIVAITNSAGKINYVNDKFCAISQYTPNELLGQDHRIVSSGYHPTAVIRDLWETISKGKVWKGELCNRAKDGSLYWVDSTIVPFMDSNGDPYQYVAIRADITDRKQAQEEVLQLNGELKNRAEASLLQLENTSRELEGFSYAVSHDLRTPLRAISGFTHALSAEYREAFDARGKDHIDRVIKASQRMSDLIDDLLRLSRVTQAEYSTELVDLSQITRSIASKLQEAEPARAVQFEIADGIVVRGDTALLQIMMQNLLENAWKFTSKNASAKIQFDSTLDTDGGRIIYVSDDGAGFDMKYAEKLFVAFQRLHSQQEFSGTGIGLAIVQRVINRHRGRVWGEAKGGVGATIYFAFPENSG